MVERLQKCWDVQRHDAAHDVRYRKDDESDIHCEPGMIEEGIENDADAFPAIDEAECVESHDEEQGHGAVETGCEDGKDGEEERGEDLEGKFSDCVLKKERFNGVSIIVVLTVEDGLFVRVYGDVLEHADKVERSKFLEVPESRLDAVVVAF